MNETTVESLPNLTDTDALMNAVPALKEAGFYCRWLENKTLDRKTLWVHTKQDMTGLSGSCILESRPLSAGGGLLLSRFSYGEDELVKSVRDSLPGVSVKLSEQILRSL